MENLFNTEMVPWMLKDLHLTIDASKEPKLHGTKMFFKVGKAYIKIFFTL